MIGSAVLLRKVLFETFPTEHITGSCLPYLWRWSILKAADGISVYLHNFVGSDWTRDIHDHPKKFWSIGIWGGYVEETEAVRFKDVGSGKPLRVLVRERRQYRAPWFRSFPPEHIHRLRVPPSGCWTIVITGRSQRVWGFVRRGIWIPFWEYFRQFDVSADCG